MPSRPKKTRDMGCEYYYRPTNLLVPTSSEYLQSTSFSLALSSSNLFFSISTSLVRLSTDSCWFSTTLRPSLAIFSLFINTDMTDITGVRKQAFRLLLPTTEGCHSEEIMGTAKPQICV